LRGVEAEILTTTIRQPGDSWNISYYEWGVYDINGVPVRRFPPRQMDPDRFLHITGKLGREGKITFAEEVELADNFVNSDALYSFIGNNADHRLYFFLPYLFGTSLNGSAITPQKSYLIPCLHDEGFAHQKTTRKMFDRANGALFLSKAEMHLAKRLYGGLPNTEAMMLGCGVDQLPAPDPDGFRERTGLGDTPFIFYVGRRGQGKNTPLLVDFFHRYKVRFPKSRLKLVFAGSGKDEIPAAIAHDVVDLGFVTIQEKADALAAATMLCQPSINESFSIVIMESWLAKRPVLVSAHSAVTKEHAVDSGGGFAFGSFAEFCEQVEFLLNNPIASNVMGERGYAYVEKNYTWPVITRRFINYLDVFSSIERAQ
jgi:glycosyltransferase involved in cell wall biosynthesis